MQPAFVYLFWSTQPYSMKFEFDSQHNPRWDDVGLELRVLGDDQPRLVAPAPDLGQLTLRRHLDDVEGEVDASAVVVEPVDIGCVTS